MKSINRGRAALYAIHMLIVLKIIFPEMPPHLINQEHMRILMIVSLLIISSVEAIIHEIQRRIP